MNLLIVDDQVEIAKSIKNGIDWSSINIENVYIASSSKEAKLNLININIDIVLSDIEMPEENGIELLEWVRHNIPNIEFIFLTAHANFSYAKKAIELGCSDYILQPVKYQDVLEKVVNASKKIKYKKNNNRLYKAKKFILEHKNVIATTLIIKSKMGNFEIADELYKNISNIYGDKPCYTHVSKIKVNLNKVIEKKWNEALISLVLANVGEEAFIKQDCKISVATISDNYYWLFLTMEKNIINKYLFEDNILIIKNFIEDKLNFELTMDTYFIDEDIKFNKIYSSINDNVIIEDKSLDSIEIAKEYIKNNLSKNITRKKVADLVHMNEQYFSKLFKKETGETFKNYIIREKMSFAKYLLENTKLSVSIIASKVGFDNFSYFSKTFKKYYDISPRDIRN